MLRFWVSTAVIAAMLVGCNKQPHVPLPALPIPSAVKPLTLEDIRAPRQVAAASCNIESIDQAALSDQAAPLLSREIVVNGWLLPEISHKAVKQANLRFLNESGTGGWQAGIGSWSDREDVLSAMKAPGAGDVGFGQYIGLTAVAPGRYRLLLVFDDNGVRYICDKGRIVIVQ